MAAVYDELAKAQPKQRFIVGIKDDVTFLSLDSDDDFSTEGDDVTRAVFFGLGSDGTVSANRSSVKIIGENTPMYSQGYFVYDSRKAGSVTTSHVRFSPRPIKGSYLVHKANFVACHQFHFTERIDMLSMAMPGATFLLNSPYGPDEVWDHLPCEVQKQIVEKKLKFYVVDAFKVAREAELGVRINTVMQTCFFKLANVIPPDEAISEIKAQVKAIYGKKGGGAIVERNNAAIDMALAGLHEVKVLASVSSKFHMVPPVPDHAPAFVKDVLGMMIANRGDELPVSAHAHRRHVPHGHHAVREAIDRPGHPHLGPEDLHPVRALLAGLPARLHPHEGLRAVAVGKGPRRASRPPTTRPRSTRAGSSSSRSPRTIARAAACASTSAPPRTRRRSSTRRSTWSRRPRTSTASGPAGTSSSRFPTSTGPRSSSTRSRARSSCCRCSSSPGPAPAAARRPTSSSSRSCSATAC